MKTCNKKRKIKVGSWVKYDREKFCVYAVDTDGRLSIESIDGEQSYGYVDPLNCRLCLHPTDSEVIVSCEFTLQDLKTLLSYMAFSGRSYPGLVSRLKRLIKSHHIK